VYEHGVPVLRPPVRLSAQSLPLFERVTRAYADGSQGGVVLDLREVRAITSAGLGHLVTLGRSLWEHEAVLVLAGANRTVLKLLKTVGLDRVLPHFTTVGEAAAWLRERRKTPS
jgi:anti-anti-sigma factor